MRQYCVLTLVVLLSGMATADFFCASNNSCEKCTKGGCLWCETTQSCSSTVYLLRDKCPTAYSTRQEHCAAADEGDHDPVLIVPGVGGSRLDVEHTMKRSREQLWLNMSGLSDKIMTAAFGQFNAKTGLYEAYNEKYYKVYSPKSVGGLFAIDTLSEQDSATESVTYYFHHTIDYLIHTLGYVPEKDLFGLPYDWRQSVRLESKLVEFRDKIKMISEKNGNKRVIILAHSMGNLVTRSLMARFPDFCRDYVSGWIAVAAPWHGAGGRMVSSLISGYNLGVPSILLDNKTMHQIQTTVPCVYQLLPDPDYSWKQPPGVKIKKKGRPAEIITGQRLAEVFRGVNYHNTQKLSGGSGGEKTVNVNYCSACADHARETRQWWAENPVPKEVKVYNFYGSGRKTNSVVSYLKEYNQYSDLLFEKFDEKTSASVDGDETVPSESASDPDFTPYENVALNGAEHQGIVADPAFLKEMVRAIKAICVREEENSKHAHEDGKKNDELGLASFEIVVLVVVFVVIGGMMGIFVHKRVKRARAKNLADSYQIADIEDNNTMRPGPLREALLSHSSVGKRASGSVEMSDH